MSAAEFLDAASCSTGTDPTEHLRLGYGSRTRNVRGLILPQIITCLGGTLTRLMVFFFWFGFLLLLCFCKRGAPRAESAQIPRRSARVKAWPRPPRRSLGLAVRAPRAGSGRRFPACPGCACALSACLRARLRPPRGAMRR